MAAVRTGIESPRDSAVYPHLNLPRPAPIPSPTPFPTISPLWYDVRMVSLFAPLRTRAPLAPIGGACVGKGHKGNTARRQNDGVDTDLCYPKPPPEPAP